MNQHFWIATGQNHLVDDVIYSRFNQLRVRVRQVGDTPLPEEVRIFGRLGWDVLMFESIDIRPDDALYMIDAVRRYAHYIGQPQMILSASL